MNLEQLLEKQEGLNDLLLLHLNDLETTVDKIVGVVPEPLNKECKAEEQPNGILEELFSAQERLEQKIDRLNLLKQRLYDSVYKNDKATIGNNVTIVECETAYVQIPKSNTSQQH